MKKSLTKFATQEIHRIHGYSKKYNKLIGRNHTEALLNLIEQHVREIAYRFKGKDRHYILETGDLLILCFELLKESKTSPDLVLGRCYQRYYRKLPQMIKEAKNGRG